MCSGPDIWDGTGVATLFEHSGLHNNLVFAKGVNRQYSDEFARAGAKIGNSINIRKPNRYFVRKGPVMNTQSTKEEYTTLELDQMWGVDISFSSVELLLSLDDFGERILTPAMARIASQIDYDGLTLGLDLFNVVGTPGTTPGSANSGANLTHTLVPQIYLNAGMQMDNQAVPRDESRRIVYNPAAMAASVAGLSGLMQDAEKIAEQYRKGVLGTALGFEFAMDQNINVLRVGTHASTGAFATTILVNGANQVGSTLQVRGFTANQTGVLKKGEVFSVANVGGVNPENQQAYGFNQQFVLTADANSDANGYANLSVYPPIVLAGTNVANGTVDALAVDGAVLTWYTGTTANAAYPQNLAYHQDAFTLGTADLEIPKGVDFAARETYEGISMRIVRQYQIGDSSYPCRIDVLGGWKTLRQELGCRIIG